MTQWVHRLSKSGSTLSGGSVAAAGGYTYVAAYDAAAVRHVVHQINPDGSAGWSTHLQATGITVGSPIVVSARGSSVVVMYGEWTGTSGAVVVARLNSADGSVVWSTKYTGGMGVVAIDVSGGYRQQLAIDSAGNVFMAFPRFSSTDGGLVGAVIHFLLKLAAADGALLWSDNIFIAGPSGDDHRASIATLSTGDVIVSRRRGGFGTGASVATIRRIAGSDGSVTWSRDASFVGGANWVGVNPDPEVIAVDPANNIYFVGSNLDVLKLDASGATLWSKHISRDDGQAIAATMGAAATADGVFIASDIGCTDGPALKRAGVVHLTADGTTVSAWSNDLGDAITQTGTTTTGVAVDGTDLVVGLAEASVIGVSRQAVTDGATGYFNPAYNRAPTPVTVSAGAQSLSAATHALSDPSGAWINVSASGLTPGASGVSTTLHTPSALQADTQSQWVRHVAPADSTKDMQGMKVASYGAYTYEAIEFWTPAELHVRVVKRNLSDGTLVWEKTYGPIASQDGTHIVASAAGVVLWTGDPWAYGTGSKIALLDLSTGSEVWSRRPDVLWTYWEYTGPSSENLVVHPSGDILVAGRTDSGKAVLARISVVDGSTVWAKVISSSPAAYLTPSVAVFDGGDVAASIADAVDGFWVFRIGASDGTVVWATKVNSPLVEQPCIAVGADGGVYVCPHTTVGLPNTQLTITKLTSAGALEWSKAYDAGVGADLNRSGGVFRWGADIIVMWADKSAGLSGAWNDLDTNTTVIDSTGGVVKAITLGGISLAWGVSIVNDTLITGQSGYTGSWTEAYRVVKTNLASIVPGYYDMGDKLPATRTVGPELTPSATGYTATTGGMPTLDTEAFTNVASAPTDVLVAANSTFTDTYHQFTKDPSLDLFEVAPYSPTTAYGTPEGGATLETQVQVDPYTLQTGYGLHTSSTGFGLARPGSAATTRYGRPLAVGQNISAESHVVGGAKTTEIGTPTSYKELTTYVVGVNTTSIPTPRMMLGCTVAAYTNATAYGEPSMGLVASVAGSRATGYGVPSMTLQIVAVGAGKTKYGTPILRLSPLLTNPISASTTVYGTPQLAQQHLVTRATRVTRCGVPTLEY